jgi:hypothetical protein
VGVRIATRTAGAEGVDGKGGEAVGVHPATIITNEIRK